MILFDQTRRLWDQLLRSNSTRFAPNGLALGSHEMNDVLPVGSAPGGQSRRSVHEFGTTAKATNGAIGRYYGGSWHPRAAPALCSELRVGSCFSAPWRRNRVFSVSSRSPCPRHPLKSQGTKLYIKVRTTASFDL